MALGRVAGSAVTRSRIRRIAREVFEQVGIEQAAPLDVLLLTRGDVSSHRRLQVRAETDRLGRDAILIELNPEYAAMARRRITNDAPLFAPVAAS